MYWNRETFQHSSHANTTSTPVQVQNCQIFPRDNSLETQIVEPQVRVWLVISQSSTWAMFLKHHENLIPRRICCWIQKKRTEKMWFFGHIHSRYWKAYNRRPTQASFFVYCFTGSGKTSPRKRKTEYTKRTRNIQQGITNPTLVKEQKRSFRHVTPPTSGDGKQTSMKEGRRSPSTERIL